MDSKSSPSFARRLLLAVVVAISAASIGNVADVSAQLRFAPEIEKQLWKTLSAWGVRNAPSNQGFHEPESDLPDPDDPEAPFIPYKWSLTLDDSPSDEAGTYNTEFAALATGECTYSHLGDYDE